MYINSAIAKTSFQRLTATVQAGKSYQEKTSSLMYFLAFDALSKKKNLTVIDFQPKSYTRKELSLEYAKLVTLPKSNGVTQQVAELGVVEPGGKEPEKRMSSNFYTVPLKKASETLGGKDYPHRPAPLLLMGNIQDGIQWGITLHSDWKTNFPTFISEVAGNTPFTDLAVFVCRNEEMSGNASDLLESLYATLKEKFTDGVASYWREKIESEKLFAKHIKDQTFFSATFQSSDFTSGATRKRVLRGMQRDQLIGHILYLEELLDSKSVKYNK